MENINNNNKVAIDSTEAAADGKGKQVPVEKPTNKRDHEAMSASSSAAPAPVVTAAPAPVTAAPEPAVAEVAANERPSPPLLFPCRMQCPHVFHSEKALCGHMRKHPGRDWKGTNPPPEASSSAQGGGNGDNEADGSGKKKKLKKGLPFDLNELPPPEEDDDAAKN